MVVDTEATWKRAMCFSRQIGGPSGDAEELEGWQTFEKFHET